MKFSIRDLFLLTLVVALVLGWLSDHWRLVRSANCAQEEASTWKLLFTFSSQAHQEFAVQLEEFDLQVTVDGVKRKPLPTSQAPAPIPPKD